MAKRNNSWGMIISGAALLAACSNSPGGSPTAGTGGSGGSGGESQDCPKAETITTGLKKTSAGNFTFELVDLNPVPPIQTDTKPGNTWKILVKDPAGNPAKGGVLQVTKFMPQHGHPSPPDAWGTEAQDGVYVISDLFFTMAGLFDTTVSFTPAGSSTKENILYKVCISHKSGY